MLYGVSRRTSAETCSRSSLVVWGVADRNFSRCEGYLEHDSDSLENSQPILLFNSCSSGQTLLCSLTAEPVGWKNPRNTPTAEAPETTELVVAISSGPNLDPRDRYSRPAPTQLSRVSTVLERGTPLLHLFLRSISDTPLLHLF